MGSGRENRGRPFGVVGGIALVAIADRQVECEHAKALGLSPSVIGAAVRSQ